MTIDEGPQTIDYESVIKAKPTKQKSPGMCGKANVIHKTEENASGPIAFFTQKVSPKMQGVLLVRKGKEFVEKQFFLKDSLFYSYSGDETYPSVIIFMLGCFVEPITEDGKYGIEIISEFGFKRKFYGTSFAD